MERVRFQNRVEEAEWLQELPEPRPTLLRIRHTIGIVLVSNACVRIAVSSARLLHAHPKAPEQADDLSSIWYTVSLARDEARRDEVYQRTVTAEDAKQREGVLYLPIPEGKDMPLEFGGVVVVSLERDFLPTVYYPPSIAAGIARYPIITPDGGRVDI